MWNGKDRTRSACVENRVRFEFNLLSNRFWGNTCNDDECSNQTCAHTHVTLKIVFRFSHSFVALSQRCCCHCWFYCFFFLALLHTFFSFFIFFQCVAIFIVVVAAAGAATAVVWYLTNSICLTVATVAAVPPKENIKWKGVPWNGMKLLGNIQKISNKRTIY